MANTENYGKYGIARADPAQTRFRVRVSEGGRITIPAALRATLKIKDGDGLWIDVENGELRVLTTVAAIRRVQELARPNLPVDRSLADELIAERRAEATRE